MSHADFRFAYRDSAFKSGEPVRWVVPAVDYGLRPDGIPTVRYAELERHLEAPGIGRPALGDVRASVLAIRRSKSSGPRGGGRQPALVRLLLHESRRGSPDGPPTSRS